MECNIHLQIFSCLMFFAWFAILSHIGADWHGSVPKFEALVREGEREGEGKGREGGRVREGEGGGERGQERALCLFASLSFCLPPSFSSSPLAAHHVSARHSTIPQTMLRGNQYGSCLGTGFADLASSNI